MVKKSLVIGSLLVLFIGISVGIFLAVQQQVFGGEENFMVLESLSVNPVQNCAEVQAGSACQERRCVGDSWSFFSTNCDTYLGGPTGIAQVYQASAGSKVPVLNTVYADNVLLFNLQESGATGGSYFKSLKVYPDEDLLFEFDLGSSEGLNILVNENSACRGTITGGLTGRGNALFKHNALNPLEVALWINGNKVCEVNDTLSPVLQFGKIGRPVMFPIKSRKLFNCKPDGVAENFVIESFSGGQVIDLYSTQVPVSTFCLDFPPILTSNSNFGAVPVPQIYSLLLAGEKYDIPVDSTLSLVYVGKTAGAVTSRCDVSSEFYSAGDKSCVPKLGTVQFCPNGVVNNGDCFTEPKTISDEFVCDGGQLIVEGNKTTCRFRLPSVDQYCKEGSIESVNGSCEAWNPASIPLPEGFERVQLNEKLFAIQPTEEAIKNQATSIPSDETKLGSVVESVEKGLSKTVIYGIIGFVAGVLILLFVVMKRKK